MSRPESSLGMQNPRPHPDPQNQNHLYFNKLSRRFVRPLEFEKHSSSKCVFKPECAKELPRELVKNKNPVRSGWGGAGGLFG